MDVLASWPSTSGLWDVETHHPFLELSVPLQHHRVGVLAEQGSKPGWRLTRPFEPDAIWVTELMAELATCHPMKHLWGARMRVVSCSTRCQGGEG